MATDQSLQIVYFGADASWRDLQQIGFRRRNTCLLREFARHPSVERVVVVNFTTRGAALRQPSWWRRLVGLGRGEKVQDVLVFAFIPGQRWVPAIGRLNLRLARWFIRRATGKGDEARTCQWCYWPDGYKQARQFGLRGPLLFDADNDILNCPVLAADRAVIEELLKDCARRAEAVVCGSRQFLARCGEFGFKRSTLLRNGVDLSRFERYAEEPEDIKSILYPRLGYVGVLSQWVDFGLLLELARGNPAWHLVLIGAPYETEIPQQLKSLRNVHFLGPRGAQEVPAYLAHFDVGLLAYRRGTDQDSMKVFEYLAAGLPVAGSDFNGRVKEDFEGLVEVAPDAAGLASAIRDLLAQPREARELWNQRRRAFLGKHTWERRGAEAVALMQELIS